MLKTNTLFNTEVATEYGTIQFDSKGECKDLTEAQEKELSTKIKEFTFVPNEPAPVKAAPKASPKPAPKPEPEPKAVEEKPKAPVKKRTTATKKAE